MSAISWLLLQELKSDKQILLTKDETKQKGQAKKTLVSCINSKNKAENQSKAEFSANLTLKKISKTFLSNLKACLLVDERPNRIGGKKNLQKNGPCL